MALPTASGAGALDGAEFLRLIADETRWLIVRMLALSDLRAGEIGAALHLPSNALSYHLKRLRTAGVLCDRHSSGDARDVYYHLDVARLQDLYAAAGDALYPGLLQLFTPAMSADGGGGGSDGPLDGSTNDTPGEPSDAPTSSRTTLSRPMRVLFLCTHNSARSQMAEALMRSMGGDQGEVYSAGSAPTEVDPEALATLHEVGIDTTGLYAKSLEQFVGEQFDYIITVCDRVRDVCPAFAGDPAQAHWSIADPVDIEDPERRAKAFQNTLTELQTRIRYLLLLPHPGTGERLWRSRPSS
jgi:ArsR family transcriptional regulator, arsenate/arsenite/antimonite-responsive transcriptional repressor / arsenate reductase (thioredoxin)